MADFNGPLQYNSRNINVSIDNQLAAILSNFNYDFIMGLVDDHIDQRLRVYQLPLPNLPAALEQNFIIATNGFESYAEEIALKRVEIYRAIINKLCYRYNLSFSNDTEETDYYSIAYWMYEFLVSKFTQNIVSFFVSYLISEKDGLYSNLGLENRKDNQYSAKLFDDPKIAAIHANLEYILDEISIFDINLWDILSRVYACDPNVANYIHNFISDEGNFFKDQYINFIKNNLADIIIQIKLGIQSAFSTNTNYYI